MEIGKRTDGIEAVGSLRLLEDMIPRIRTGLCASNPFGVRSTQLKDATGGSFQT